MAAVSAYAAPRQQAAGTAAADTKQAFEQWALQQVVAVNMEAADKGAAPASSPCTALTMSTKRLAHACEIKYVGRSRLAAGGAAVA